MIKKIILIVVLLQGPFFSYAQEFEISGILKGEDSAAIINGKVLRVGDEIDGYEILGIQEGFVDFKGDKGVFRRSIQEDTGKASEEYYKKQRKKSLPLFVGFQVDDFKQVDTFEILADETCSVYINDAEKVEKNVYSQIFTKQDEYYAYMYINITNKSNMPIEFNYTADEFYCMHKNGSLKKIDLYFMGRDYPELLNPGERDIFYKRQKRFFEDVYGKLKDIRVFIFSFDYGQRQMLFKQCPSAEF